MATKIRAQNHIFLFIFTILSINNIYELYIEPVTDIFSGCQDRKHYESFRGIAFIPPGRLYPTKNFQSQFDVPLTEVVGRKNYITNFGREIAVAVENILNQVYAINYKTLAYKGQLIGRLKISVVSTGKYVMPFFLSEFLHQHPGIELLMDVTNKKRVLESLENNDVDFALASILPIAINIECLDLLPNRLFLVGKANQQCAPSNDVNEVFKDLPLIFREKGSGTRQAMEAFIAEHKISSIKKMELTSNEAVKKAILAGLGYSIMP